MLQINVFSTFLKIVILITFLSVNVKVNAGEDPIYEFRFDKTIFNIKNKIKGTITDTDYSPPSSELSNNVPVSVFTVDGKQILLTQDTVFKWLYV